MLEKRKQKRKYYDRSEEMKETGVFDYIFCRGEGAIFDGTDEQGTMGQINGTGIGND